MRRKAPANVLKSLDTQGIEENTRELEEKKEHYRTLENLKEK